MSKVGHADEIARGSASTRPGACVADTENPGNACRSSSAALSLPPSANKPSVVAGRRERGGSMQLMVTLGREDKELHSAHCRIAPSRCAREKERQRSKVLCLAALAATVGSFRNKASAAFDWPRLACSWISRQRRILQGWGRGGGKKRQDGSAILACVQSGWGMGRSA